MNIPFGSGGVDSGFGSGGFGSRKSVPGRCWAFHAPDNPLSQITKSPHMGT